MNRLLFILCILLIGCVTEKKTMKLPKDKHVLKNVVYDSVPKPKVVLTSRDLDPPVKDYLIIERGDGLYPDKELKIIEVNNTKVVKQNSDFSEGRVVYKIPEIMKIRSMYKVIVRICKSRYTVSVYDSLIGTVRTSRIPVTETMEVDLIDPSPTDDKFFHIIPDNEAIQIIENGDTYTEWTWNVTPIKIGSSKLKVVVSVIRNGNKKDVVYEDSVKIEKDFFVQLKYFVKDNWKWSLTTLVIPFFVWLYKKRKKEKEDDGESKTI